MTTVITYGTYDLLHYGHIRLLERAKALGDYLIVGVTSDDFDKMRGKINVQQTLEERIKSVRETGIADKIIIEEYEGQKIDDIKKYFVDIFTVGSDWGGKFDYLNEYCHVVYLERTHGVSSSEIRNNNQSIRFGLVGYANYLNKVYRECQYVNGINISALCSDNIEELSEKLLKAIKVTSSIDDFLSEVDAVYVHSHPKFHYNQIKTALLARKHVMCESPIALSENNCIELFNIAKENNCVLMESLRTAYSMAYARMLLLIKGGKIGEVVSIDATCTSLCTNSGDTTLMWNSMSAWGPTALLPIFQILGTNYKNIEIISRCSEDRKLDRFSKIDLRYEKSVATVKIGSGVKSEGELIVSGTKGYVYVPAPWWKTDYFEIRYENHNENKRYFYQLDGEGIRYEWVVFLKMINAYLDGQSERGFYMNNIDKSITVAISQVMEQFENGDNVKYI